MDRVGTATEKTDPQCRQQMGTPQQKPNLPGSEQLPAHHADEKGGAAVVAEEVKLSGFPGRKVSPGGHPGQSSGTGRIPAHCPQKQQGGSSGPYTEQKPNGFFQRLCQKTCQPCGDRQRGDHKERKKGGDDQVQANLDPFSC